MKTLIAAVIALSTATVFAADTYKLDTKATKVEWVGKKIGGEHKGTINAQSGSLTVDGDLITGGEVVMDMNSITVTDLQGEWKDKLEAHLKNADFFDVTSEAGKTAKLVIKSSKKTPKGLEVTGDLTIRGKTNPVTFTATDIKKDAKSYNAKALITINRVKYGVEYNSKSWVDLGKVAADKAIHDDFTLNVTLVGTK